MGIRKLYVSDYFDSKSIFQSTTILHLINNNVIQKIKNKYEKLNRYARNFRENTKDK